MKYALIGASRGLGRAVVAELILSEENQLMIFSRRQNGLPQELWKNCDVTNGVTELISDLKSFMPDSIFYFVGGGPYASFEENNWRDHEWALKATLLAPTEILHAMMRFNEKIQLVFLGSAIAESGPDKGAASYASAKHALKGLITTINLESPQRDIRLYSPGYMDTDLLPKNAAPRQAGSVMDPKTVAKDFLQWVHESCQNKHRRYQVP